MKQLGNFYKQEINLYLNCIEENVDLQKVLMDHLQKTKKVYNNLKKQEIQDTIIKTS